MKVLRTVSETRAVLKGRDSIGFVPTMGAFHEGHLELMRRSLASCETTVVSLFVNPIQFSSQEDFDKYPRDDEVDFQMASDLGIDYLFAPSADEILLGRQTTVHVAGVSEQWEGRSRPGHFDGVATIVLKLFHIVAPKIAFFGLKDLQQCAVVRKMVADLNIDINIQTVNTVRAPSGLALSSRNRRLSAPALQKAPLLYKSLTSCIAQINSSPLEASAEIDGAKSLLEGAGFHVDYLALIDPATMLALEKPTPDARLVAAVVLDGIRLIDNVGIDGQ